MNQKQNKNARTGVDLSSSSFFGQNQMQGLAIDRLLLNSQNIYLTNEQYLNSHKRIMREDSQLLNVAGNKLNHQKVAQRYQLNDQNFLNNDQNSIEKTRKFLRHIQNKTIDKSLDETLTQSKNNGRKTSMGNINTEQARRSIQVQNNQEARSLSTSWIYGKIDCNPAQINYEHLVYQQEANIRQQLQFQQLQQQMKQQSHNRKTFQTYRQAQIVLDNFYQPYIENADINNQEGPEANCYNFINKATKDDDNDYQEVLMRMNVVIPSMSRVNSKSPAVNQNGGKSQSPPKSKLSTEQTRNYVNYLRNQKFHSVYQNSYTPETTLRYPQEDQPVFYYKPKIPNIQQELHRIRRKKQSLTDMTNQMNYTEEEANLNRDSSNSSSFNKFYVKNFDGNQGVSQINMPPMIDKRFKTAFGFQRNFSRKSSEPNQRQQIETSNSINIRKQSINKLENNEKLFKLLFQT